MSFDVDEQARGSEAGGGIKIRCWKAMRVLGASEFRAGFEEVGWRLCGTTTWVLGFYHLAADRVTQFIPLLS